MINTSFRKHARPVFLLAGLAMLIGLSACKSTQEREQIARQNDSQTCLEFGTAFGSKEYAECMLRQQDCRDNAALKAAELQRAAAETTRHNTETVRRLGCEREAEKERKRGEKPRDCR
ncbi:hypothetical protein [Alishewanella longhuensis]